MIDEDRSLKTAGRVDCTRKINQNITADKSSRDELLAERDSILARLGEFARPQLALAV